MSSQNLIICEDKILYEIFLEIKEYLKFELKFFSKKDILKIKSENINNYLILTYENITNLNHILKIDKSPIKIIKLIEKINITFLKKKFNEQSKVKINNYNIDLNSREIVLQNKKLKLTEKEITTILYLLNKKKEVTVSELQNKVWGYQKELETHTVETHIHRLRKKILQTFGDNKFINSNKNGYQIS
tara:strand:+ start:643 stop:1206 length:564 start_codon:yes stop_codon:yes gene_type:complete